MAERSMPQVNRRSAPSSARQSGSRKSSRMLQPSLRVHRAAKPNRAGPVDARSQQEILSVLIELPRLGEVPVRFLRAIIAAALQHGGAGVVVLKLIGPLPNVADEIQHAEWT